MTNTMSTLPDDSSTRFSLLELDGPTADTSTKLTVDPVASIVRSAAIPEQSAPDVQIVNGLPISQEAVARIKRDEIAAIAAGFSPEPPIYESGTLVNETGVANFAKSRKEWDQLPLIGDACQEVSDIIAAEARKDICVNATDLLMTEDGQLNIPEVGLVSTTPRAITTLADFTTPGGGGFLARISSKMRSIIFNHHFPLAVNVDVRASNKEGTEVNRAKQIMVRTRMVEGVRTAYAVTGPRYTPYDINQIIERIYNAYAKLGRDCRVKYKYNGYKLQFDVLYHTNIQPAKAGAGEFFMMGQRITTADDGSGGINISLEAWRNLCRNLIVIQHDTSLIGRKRHTGKASTIEEKINEHLETADVKMAYFAKAWDAATTENILERYDLGDPREVFRGLVLNGVVTVPGIKPDEMVNRLMSAWSKEMGYSKASFINAITRSAHENQWDNWDTEDELETKGSELLFARSWQAVPPREQTVESLLGGF